ncbi:MAG: N-acetylmuramoyl-L-alanine amidase CwlD [Clostridiales bacterium]|nr:N-acetylmuramoyl-L-alanine amidase CwlD [Clostridiales bacterium]
MRVYFINRRWLFVFWAILGVVIASLYFVKTIGEKTLFVSGSPAYGAVIVVDAGHGGMDPGAVSANGTREDKINLKIAKKLRTYLENEGSKVIMTRKTDEGLYDSGHTGSKKQQDMARRVEIIQKAEPDMVISIHLNKFPQSQYYGAQTFYLKDNEEGELLAKNIQEHLLRVLKGGNKRDIKAADNYLILKVVNRPSVLVECGFLSNPQEEMLLLTDDYQESIAWAIYCGIISYLSQG